MFYFYQARILKRPNKKIGWLAVDILFADLSQLEEKYCKKFMTFVKKIGFQPRNFVLLLLHVKPQNFKLHFVQKSKMRKRLVIGFSAF